jgi:hypothetical protein
MPRPQEHVFLGSQQLPEVHTPVDSRMQSDRLHGEAALAALRGEAAKWGVELVAPAWDQARFELQTDPFSGEQALLARWTAEREGMVTVRGDGTVYAEWDLLAAHPRDPRYWIESVLTWGRPPDLKSEPRLLEMPDES